jgi:arylsulfatase A-like enzyme
MVDRAKVLRCFRPVGLIGLSLAPIVSCGGSPRPAACADLSWDGPQPAANVILIVNDAMRRDRVGIYGGPARTPAFDAFARENVLFERAFTQAPWTKPSIATLFTSLYPSQHGVLSHPSLNAAQDSAARDLARVDLLALELTTLAEVLGRNGYRTAAFVGNPWLLDAFGFAQGFDEYHDDFAGWDVPGEAISQAGLEWLDRTGSDRPFFLYLHYMDSHRPYPGVSRWRIAERRPEIETDLQPVSPFAAQTIADHVKLEGGLRAIGPGLPPRIALYELAYDGGVEAFDRALSSFLDGFRRHPAWPRTAIWVTSDHGEALLRRGFANHGTSLYDDEIAIPLAVRLPGVRAADGRVACPIGLIDVLPTLCGYLGVDCPDEVAGVDVFDVRLLGALDARKLVSEGVMHKPAHRCLRTETYKLLWQPQGGPDGKLHALFDVRADPGETRDLLADAADPAVRRTFDTLASELSSLVPSFRPAGPPTAPLDPAQIERLQSLGYLN